jgi:hypothetical protein
MNKGFWAGMVYLGIALAMCIVGKDFGFEFFMTFSMVALVVLSFDTNYRLQ